MANCPQPTVGPPPDAAILHAAALAYLARYAATEAELRRVLDRRVERWARVAATAAADPDAIATQAKELGRIVREVVARLVSAGAVSDQMFAENRAQRLIRSGRSHRAVVTHLIAKGVDPKTARAVLTEQPNREFAAALVLARKKRIGPFRSSEPLDRQRRHYELAILARAGFPEDVARRALATTPEEAEAIVNELRR